MAKNLFFEIGTEEIPARFITKAINEMKVSLEKQFKEYELNYSSIDIFATPRRFAIHVKDLDEVQADKVVEYKGPSKKIAVDSDGNLTKAALGFLRGKGASEKDIVFKNVGNEEYLHVNVEIKGIEVVNILKDIFETMIRSVVFPKSMRWGGKNIRFVRPIRWLICLFGNKLIEFDIEGIKTGNLTKGHRFLGKQWIEVSSFEDYVTKLEENFVILEQDKRRKIILDKCHEVAKSIGGNLVVDEEILDEVNFIVEYPTAFYGNYREEYLKLPKEVITTPMQAHQRYFPVVDDNGNLINKFITVRNGDEYMIDNVRKGNEKVLEARLRDAEFFYEEDTKNKLESYVEKLGTIVFQQKLGTILDKVSRIEKLSSKIAASLDYKSEDLLRAAKLCKADLTTAMVFEFGELQGIMGRYYAKLSGESDTVANAIFEHYLPRNSSDILPETMEGTILSIADKMDSLAGFFAIGITPTGSQDPYALRRQALSIISILENKKIEISLESLIDMALQSFDFIEFDLEKTKEELYTFMNQRLDNIMSEENIRYDIVNAVSPVKDGYVFEKICKAKELQKWCESDRTEVLSAYARVANLSKNYNESNVCEEKFVDQSERDLWEKVLEVEKVFNNYYTQMKYYDALNSFDILINPINTMFDSVMIMDKDESIKNNRLALLVYIKKMFLRIADISEILYK